MNQDETMKDRLQREMAENPDSPRGVLARRLLAQEEANPSTSEEERTRRIALEHERYAMFLEARKIDAAKQALSAIDHQGREALMEKLREVLMDEMASDSDYDGGGHLLWDYFDLYTPEQQRAVDKVFVTLCGWSFTTLLQKAGLAFTDPEVNPGDYQ